MTEASWEHRGTATGPLPPQGSEPQQDARKAEAGSPGLRLPGLLHQQVIETYCLASLAFGVPELRVPFHQGPPSTYTHSSSPDFLEASSNLKQFQSEPGPFCQEAADPKLSRSCV